MAKYAATRAALPMVAVATNLAHDGICSPVASLEHPHGKGSYGVALPARGASSTSTTCAPPRHARARRDRRRGEQPLRRSRTGSWPAASAGSRSTGWPRRSPAPPARRSSTAPTASRTTTSSSRWPRRWCCPAWRCRWPAPRGRAAARATRSSTRSTRSTPGAPTTASSPGSAPLFATFLRGDDAVFAQIAELPAPSRAASLRRRHRPERRAVRSPRSSRRRGPAGPLHDPGAPRSRRVADA